MAAAEGLTALLSRLDAVAKGGQGSASVPQVVETIQVIAILYPGLVPDRDARLQAMKSAADANPDLARAKDCPDATLGTRDGLSIPALAERRLQTLKRQSR